MASKTSILTMNPAQAEDTYPYFGVNGTGRIVLFKSYNTGTIIVSGDYTPIGTISGYFEENNYTKFNGTINIETQ